MAKDRKMDMVILGLLSHENMTGYDIKKNIDNAISFFWKGSFGNIYPALSALEADGRIEKVKKPEENRKAGDEKTSGREKIRYSITDSGREMLGQWLNDEKTVNDLKYESLLKLYFGNNAGSAITIKMIDSFEKDIREGLLMLRYFEGNLSKALDNPDHVYFYLTVRFGVETYETYLRWCSEAREMLGKLR